MLQKPEYRAKRACGNMAANFHTVYNMLRRTDRSSDNLRTETIVCIHIDNVCHQCQAVAADIIQASDKRRSVSSARLSGQQGLSLPEISVQLVRMPSLEKVFTARIPSFVHGTLTTICSWSAANSRPSRIIASYSVDNTSALTSPSTILHISI